MKKIIITYGLLVICTLAFSQTIIYSEDFTGQNNQGAIGPGGTNPSLDLSAVDWTLDLSDNTLNFTDSNDYFIVRTISGNEVFEGRDIDGAAVWISPNINIAGYSNVSFSLDISESNGTATSNLENSDSILVEYSLDNNGIWIQAATNGFISDDFDAVLTSQTGLSGSNLAIKITVANNANGERHRFDNIEVRGTADCSSTFSLPFNEDFEGATFAPDCWSSYRGTNDLGSVNDWTSTTLASNSGTTAAFVEYEVVSGGNAEDWLVTPGIDLGTAHAQLRFFAREQFTIDYNTEYSVRISQTSATDINSFTTVKTYNETELGLEFNEKTIDLSSYSGVVYIAFVMEQNDGDNWYLDDVSVIDISSCTVPEDVSNVTARFDGNGINLSWALSTCYEDILIIGREGNPVTAIPSGNGSSYNPDTFLGNGNEIVPNEYVVFNAIGNEVSISNVNFGNTYYFQLFARKGTSWSEGIPISIAADYCSVTGDTTFATAISLVNFGSINNASAKTTGYDDYTAQSTSMARGTSEDLTVQINTDGNYTVYTYAWIDWNKDGDFDDSGETYDLGNAENVENGATSNSPLSITVPNDAALGDTRMRILCQYYFNTVPTNGPCDGSTDGEIEDYTITVLPGITYVYDDGWSPADPSGVATSANPIHVVRGNAIISSTTTCESILVDPAASLTVNSGVVLDVENAVDLESSSIAYSSLILDGTINGTVNYHRHVNAASGSGAVTGNNDLISAPLQGQTFGELNTTNTNILSGTIGGNPAYLFGPFDTTTNAYVNYTPANDTNPLVAGLGYRTGSTDNGVYTFSGTVATGDVEVTVTEGGATNWNLVGNPYPSYINVQTVLNETTNRDRFDENAIGIYGYDGAATDGWTIYNLATTDGSTLIAPGQGFFVDAETSGVFRFTPSMRTTGTSDDFILGRNSNPLTFLKLDLNSTNGSRFHTDFYFNTNSSRSLDPGYDASVWNGEPGNFSIHSYLIEDDNGIAMALQSLHQDDISDVTIPLGIHGTSGETVIFSISESTLPSTINIYLEDAATGTITLLNSNDYEIILDTNIIAKGRFYLRLVNQTLSTNEENLAGLQLFTDQNQRTLIVKGNLNTEAQLQIFDIQGRVVNATALAANTSSQYVNLGELPSGVYVVSIKNDNATKTKKIILK
ncbi:MAG: T9SS type A sorting domain-containing protein [Winogradskyella sp.]|uniref:T9SS-dependent choice-of-anchor J family protein n=1 Tax=Winogradskyella sp. TaxID=1883156 RepID=UPI0025D95EE8|nr:choice-of-anchor J domain-containing protein [Winogradskyella sp.]NRB84841.1 T9SS type A sorting domain-containing protein [Winogradskyella sp.]